MFLNNSVEKFKFSEDYLFGFSADTVILEKHAIYMRTLEDLIVTKFNVNFKNQLIVY